MFLNYDTLNPFLYLAHMVRSNLGFIWDASESLSHSSSSRQHTLHHDWEHQVKPAYPSILLGKWEPKIILPDAAFVKRKTS